MPVPTILRVPRQWLVGGVGALYVLYVATRSAVFDRFPVFWDEGFHVATAQTGLTDPGQRFDAMADGKPPLFSWLAMWFIHLGVSPLDAVRLVSFLAGLITLTAVLVVARWVVGDAGALIAGLLYVTSPYMLVHDVYGLLDGLFAAMMTLALAAQIRMARSPSVANAVVVGAAAGAAILTRQVGYLSLLLLPLSLLAFDWDAEARAQRLRRWSVAAVGAALLALLIASIQTLSPYREIATPKQNRPVGAALKAPFSNVNELWPSFSSTMTGYIGWGVLVLAVVGAAAAIRRRDTRVVLIGLWSIAPAVLVFLLLRFGFPRYFVPMFPPMVLLGVYGALALDERLSQRLDSTSRIAVRVGVGVLVLIAPLVLFGKILASPGTAPYPSDDRSQLVSGWTAGTGLPEVADILKRQAGHEVTVVAAVAYTPWNLAALLGGPVRFDYGPVPYQDNARVTLADGRVLEFVNATDRAGRDAQFLLTYDEFGIPSDLDLTQYRLIYSFTRPGGATFAGEAKPVTVLRFYERRS
jgi:4-amino-4-deoxy-L-arabinose transferase-like glycosyltransferase